MTFRVTTACQRHLYCEVKFGFKISIERFEKFFLDKTLLISKMEERIVIGFQPRSRMKMRVKWKEEGNEVRQYYSGGRRKSEEANEEKL